MSEKEQSKVTNITLGFVVGWLFGILCSISAIGLLMDGKILPAFLASIIAAILLPPTNQFCNRKYKINLSGGVKFIAIIALLILIGKSIEKDGDNSNTTTIPSAEKISLPREYKSALNKAASYAESMHMSKLGVYDQLVSDYGEKFSAESAQYAIDNVKVDWNANALVKARSYQSSMNMSPAAIHDQLTSEHGEKFTQAEADYAIHHLND